MSLPGVKATNLPLATLADSLIVVRGGNARQMEPAHLSAQLGAINGPTYETRALLYADLAWPAGSVGKVVGDATLAYRGIYKKSGGSGSGSWAHIGPLPEADAEGLASEVTAAREGAADLAGNMATKATQAQSRVAYNGAQLAVVTGKMVPSAASSITVSWTTARATFAGAAAAVASIADVTDLIIAVGEAVYIDLAGGSSPYAVTKAATSAPLRADFASGAKMLLLYNNSGMLIGPMVGALQVPTMAERVAAAYNNAQLSVVRGRVAADGTSRIVSWTTARATFAGAPAAFVTIADVADLVLATNEVAYIDLAGSSSPYAVAKAVTSAALRADFATGKKMLLLHNNSGTLIGPMYAALVAPLLLDRASWNPDEIVVAVRPSLNQVDVWQKANPHPSDAAYMRWRVSHQTEAGNYDVWRLNGVYDETRLDRFTFSQVRRICSTGEFETAIQQTGKPDFMGGSVHGDEVLSSATLLVDGVAVLLSPADANYYRARCVELVQASTLYEVGTSLGNAVASVVKRWVWRGGEMYLHQRVEWLAAISLNGAFLAMLPIERVQDGVPEFKITTGAMREPLWAPIDVSNPGHDTPETSAGFIKIYGGLSGYAAEVEVIKGWSKPNRRSMIEDDPAYNKLRFDVCGIGYAASLGEIWETTARYRLAKVVPAVGTV